MDLLNPPDADNLTIGVKDSEFVAERKDNQDTGRLEKTLAALVPTLPPWAGRLALPCPRRPFTAGDTASNA